MWHSLKLLLISLALVSAADVQSNGITGQWTEPTGSVIRVDYCGSEICMWVVAISPKAPADVDIYNPDPAKRRRPLCGLQIGSGFELHSTTEAKDGTLYDPKSGKTYHGQMTLHGKNLELRGYIGFPLFGETQIWVRPIGPVKACSPNSEEK
jgi:uncharacterized protein (DUF2147 family)